jgi:hypothetical protein
VLDGRWYDITVLNVHAPPEDKNNDSSTICMKKQSKFHLPKSQMKIISADFKAKVGKEDIFKPTSGNESLHEHSMIMMLEQ